MMLHKFLSKVSVQGKFFEINEQVKILTKSQIKLLLENMNTILGNTTLGMPYIGIPYNTKGDITIKG